VRGIARPSSDSEINFELWLPPANAWNGKYHQRGNGGWAGGIPSWDLGRPLARGYAALRILYAKNSAGSEPVAM
jgi:feruloyl esterase